jgi:flavin-dependent dehydrogenase
VTNTPDAEVLVIGAGPAGVATALSAARSGARVWLLDRARFPRDKPCGEGLQPGAVRALGGLRILEEVRSLGCPLFGIELRDTCGHHFRFDFRDGIGLGIQRLKLDSALVHAADREPGVTVAYDTNVVGLLWNRDRVVGVRTSRGEIRARVIVAADGLRSMVRRLLQLEAPPVRRRLGLRVHLRHRKNWIAEPYVRVILSSPFEFYLTPVGGDVVQVAVLGEHRAFVDAALSAHQLFTALHTHPALDSYLDGAEPLDRPLGAGPMWQVPRALHAHGVLLVGDAAGYLDALTGEGIGLALRHGWATGALIAEALRERIDEAPSPELFRRHTAVHRALVRRSNLITRAALFFSEHPKIRCIAFERIARHPRLVSWLLAMQAHDFSGS